MKSCYFIGHRDAPDSLQERLNELVEELVKKCDVTEFIVGNYGNFDRMATVAVQKAKERKPELYAYRMIPYHPFACKAPIPDYFDDLYYPHGMEEVPKRYAITRANRIVLDESDYLVAYAVRSGGNASALVKRARSLEKRGLVKVINLADSGA